MNNCDRPLLLVGSRTLCKEFSPKKEASSIASRAELLDNAPIVPLNRLFARQVNRVYRDLKPAIEDIDVAKGLSAEPEELELCSSGLLLQGSDRLAKAILSRNGEAKRSINEYMRTYREKHDSASQSQTLTLEHTQETFKGPLLKSKARIRPASSRVIKLISVTSLSDRHVRSKELPNNSPPPTAKIVEFECQHLPKFFAPLDETSRQYIAAPRPERQIRNPQIPQESESARTSIMELTKRYLPNFTCRQRVDSSNSCQRRNQAEILRDRIRLINTGIPVKVAKQQGYRRKCRDPRPFNQFFL